MQTWRVPGRVILTAFLAASVFTPPFAPSASAASCPGGLNKQVRAEVHEPQFSADGARMMQ